MSFTVFFTQSAKEDLRLAKKFYAQIDEGLGQYCIDSLILDAERLTFSAGVHPVKFGYYRMIARTFPYSIYYKILDKKIIVSAFIDNRRKPASIKTKLFES